MPTDVSTPDWACGKCDTRFGQDHKAASRCESAPVPDALPEGTPMISTLNGRLLLDRLTPSGNIGTRASQHEEVTGHFHHYRTGRGGGDHSEQGDRLLPGTAGSLQHKGYRWALHLHVGQHGQRQVDVAARLRPTLCGRPPALLLVV